MDQVAELLRRGVALAEANPWVLAAGAATVVLAFATLGVAVLLWGLLRLRRSLRAQLEDTGRSFTDAILERSGDLAQLQSDHMRSLREDVSEHLVQVQRGVGEIRGLAGGWTELQRTLGNVKRRGSWGEAQLEQLLGDVLAPDQYQLQVALRAGSPDRVDAAVRLRSAEGTLFYLPIDSKFPLEDYLSLLEARERDDRDQEARATRQLAARVRSEARRIASKYVSPPETTDFAILFVPTESLYAEIARIPGLLSTLHQETSITLAGPGNLAGLLGSIRLGLRAVALQERAGELWQQLGLLQAEVDQLLGQLERARRQVGAATRSLETAAGHAGALQHRLAHADRLQELGAPAEGVSASDPAGVRESGETARTQASAI